MGNLNRKTSVGQLIEGPDGTVAEVMTDGSGNKRLRVDAQIGSVTLSSIVNECNIFLTDIFTITTKTETTIRTYTVPTGKTFRLVVFQANADHPLAIDIKLKVNGVEKIKFYLDPGFGRDNQYFYTQPAIFATAGQVITITEEPSAPRGEVNTILAGIEL